MTDSILLDIPVRFESQRRVIRCPLPGDGAVVLEAIVELRQWSGSLPWATEEPSLAVSEMFCRRGAAAYATRRDFPMHNTCVYGRCT